LDAPSGRGFDGRTDRGAERAFTGQGERRPIAAALARKSSYVASRNEAKGETLPGLGRSPRAAGELCGGCHLAAAARAGASPRRHTLEQMLDDRSGDVARRRFLQAAPSGDPVHLDDVHRAIARGRRSTPA